MGHYTHLGVFMGTGVDRTGLPFEETSRRPRGLRKGIVGGLGRLYRHGVAVADGEVPGTIPRKIHGKATAHGTTDP